MRTLNTADGVAIVKNQQMHQLRYMRRLYGIPFIFVVRYGWYHPKVRTQYGIIEGTVVRSVNQKVFFLIRKLWSEGPADGTQVGS